MLSILNLLKWFVAIIAFMVVFYLSISVIVLIIVRLVSGRFSNAYTKTFYFFYRRKLFTTATKKGIMFHLEPFLDTFSVEHVFKTLVPITFHRIQFGDSIQKLLHVKGKPHTFSVDHLNRCEIQILGYSGVFHKRKCRLRYYFVNRMFFMGEYIFDSVKDDSGSRLSEFLFQDYQIEQGSSLNEFSISDDSQTKLHYLHSGFNISIKLFNNKLPNLASCFNVQAPSTN